MSLYNAFLDHSRALRTTTPPSVLVNVYLLPLAKVVDSHAAEIERLKAQVDSLTNRLNAPPVVQRTVLTGGYGDDLAAAGV